MKKYTLDQVQDKLIGEIGTPNRDLFEHQLKIDIIENATKKERKELE